MDEKTKKIIINILGNYLSNSRQLLKDCQTDKSCNLETYEDIVDKCQQTEYAIEQMENLK